jgi:hypothetical protein
VSRIQQHLDDVWDAGTLMDAIAFEVGAVGKQMLLHSIGEPMNSRRTERKAATTPETCGAATLVPVMAT